MKTKMRKFKNHFERKPKVKDMGKKYPNGLPECHS